MTRRISRGALALYPLAFRRRYGAEIRVLIEDSPATPWVVFDLLRGALLAHLRPSPSNSATVGVDDRLRASSSAVLACWIAFAAAGFGFYKTTEDHPFSRAGDSHLALGGSHLAVQVLAVLASIAVLAGALPLLVAALRQATRDPKLRAAAGLAFGSLAIFAALTVGLIVLAHSRPVRPGNAARIAFLVWLLAGLACGAACAVAARRGLFAAAISRRKLTTALASGTLLTAVMALIAFATALYLAALLVDASALAADPNGPFGTTSVTVSLGFQLAVMLAATALATVTTRRGWLALRSQPA